jgi:hypothetical protein
MESIFEIVLVIIFGAIFGSYATLFAYRLPFYDVIFISVSMNRIIHNNKLNLIIQTEKSPNHSRNERLGEFLSSTQNSVKVSLI